MSKPTGEQLAHSFVAYLKEEGLYPLLADVVTELQEEVFRNQDISVISATDLEKKERETIEKDLIEKWGDHRVVFTTDATILSGMIIRFQDNILDLSGRNSLKDLKENLTK